MAYWTARENLKKLGLWLPRWDRFVAICVEVVSLLLSLNDVYSQRWMTKFSDQALDLLRQIILTNSLG